MIPGFAPEGGVWLPLCRAAGLATVAIALGTALVARGIAPQADRASLGPVVGKLLWVACAGTLVWLFAQVLDYGGLGQLPGGGGTALWGRLVLVLRDTAFGHIVIARFLLLGVAGLLWRRDFAWGAVSACGAAAALQAGVSHAAAVSGYGWLALSAAVHVLAASAWLGALPALFWVLGRCDRGEAAEAARRFGQVGVLCAGALVVTAAAQFAVLVKDVPGLVGTAYGWVLGAKMLLFAALLVLAARNRWWLTPALADGGEAMTRRALPVTETARQSQRGASLTLAALPRNTAGFAAAALRRAAAAEIALGILVACAAALLAELEPPMHVQVLWPFGVLPSLEAVRDDPDIAREVSLGAAALVLGLGVGGGAIFKLARGAARGAARAWYGGAVVVGAVGVALAAPHLSPLFVETEPTVFFRSPTQFAAASILRGQTLYGAHCVACHGAAGRGDGPAAHGLDVPPADLTAAHLWMHPDGELFWWLTHGIDSPRGGLAMPGFAALDDDDRWALIDYVRAHNAGLVYAKNNAWPAHIRLPEFSLACLGGENGVGALRGHVLRVVFGAGQVRVLIDGRCAACVGDDAAAQAALAMVTGMPAGAVLVDAEGWLRAAAAKPEALHVSSARSPLAAPDAMAGMKM